MSKGRSFFSSFMQLLTIVLASYLPTSQALAEGGRVSGYVYDISGKPVPQAMVTVSADANHKGPDAFTAFSDAQGKFGFPEALAGISNPEQQVSTRVLGYKLEKVATASKGGGQTLTVILRKTANYAATAPASAWVAKLEPDEKETLLAACTACHQTLIPQQRAYAKLIHDVTEAGDVEARKKLWGHLTQYMSYLGSEEFMRGVQVVQVPDVGYGTGPINTAVVDLIVKVTDMYGPTLDFLDRYEYGAPFAVTPDTSIVEYEVAKPNAVREGVMLGTPPRLYVADSEKQAIHEIDVATGEQEIRKIPTQKGGPGTHSLYRDNEGMLWVTCTCSTLSRFDPNKKTWQTWDVSQHDLGINASKGGNMMTTDYKGRVWIAGGASKDYLGNYPGFGYLDPKTGEIKSFLPPEVAGRPRSMLLYSIAITADRKRLWYTLPGNGVFGEFNIETLTFGKTVAMPGVHSAPHRLTITEDDILFVPLMDAGQLVKYDTRSRQLLAVYDLPDRAAVPYAATYDPVRKALWLATSNADAIFRFDIKTERFSILPLPRTNAFVRQVDVQPETGLLTTSYSNLPYHVHGPRMALIIDPGDNAYPKQKNAISRLLSAK